MIYIYFCRLNHGFLYCLNASALFVEQICMRGFMFESVGTFYLYILVVCKQNKSCGTKSKAKSRGYSDYKSFWDNSQWSGWMLTVKTLPTQLSLEKYCLDYQPRFLSGSISYWSSSSHLPACHHSWSSPHSSFRPAKVIVSRLRSAISSQIMCRRLCRINCRTGKRLF